VQNNNYQNDDIDQFNACFSNEIGYFFMVGAKKFSYEAGFQDKNWLNLLLTCQTWQHTLATLFEAYGGLGWQALGIRLIKKAFKRRYN